MKDPETDPPEAEQAESVTRPIGCEETEHEVAVGLKSTPEKFTEAPARAEVIDSVIVGAFTSKTAEAGAPSLGVTSTV